MQLGKWTLTSCRQCCSCSQSHWHIGCMNLYALAKRTFCKLNHYRSSTLELVVFEFLASGPRGGFRHCHLYSDLNKKRGPGGGVKHCHLHGDLHHKGEQ